MAEKNKYGEVLEKIICDIITINEYDTGARNLTGRLDDFRSYIDLFDAVRSEKDYSWMSDIFIPEFPLHIITQSANDVDQYFQTKDFVETYVMDESDEAKNAAAAAEECINRTLNRKDLYHYHKFVRAKLVNHLNGYVYAHCWWDQKLKTETVGYEIAEDGTEIPIKNQVPVIDQFDYEILDPRNVVTDSKYVYSIQEKDWITLRYERTLEQLKQEKKRFGYFNLDLLEGKSTDGDTEVSRVRKEEEPEEDIDNTMSYPFDIYRRYGKFWYKDGKPGLDEEKKPLEDATQEECVMTVAQKGNTKVLIGFHKTPYKDANGQPYKPIIRGLCYIHPTRDSGVGDGRYSRELQIGINDTFNLNNDRTRLATMPTLKVRKYVAEDSDSIYFAPEHMMEVENPDDITEMRLDDNIQGGLQQLGMLTGKMQEVNAVYPTTMGQLPAQTSTTATAVAEAGAYNTKRNNYKATTFENTFLIDLYWMIEQMTLQFAKPETGFRLMGEKVYDFDLAHDFYYKPLSQSIQTEFAKSTKIRNWTQILGYVSQLQHPDTVKIVNYIMVEIASLMGDEYVNFVNNLLRPEIPIQNQSGGVGGGQGEGAPSNQYAIPQGASQYETRQIAGG